MVGKLEDVLLRLRPRDSDGRSLFRERLFNYLDDGASLLILRSLSRVLHDILEFQRSLIFRQLYIHAPLSEHEDMAYLETVAPYCQNLTITVGHARPSSTSSTRSGSQISRRSHEFVQTLLHRLNQVGQNNDQARRDSVSYTPPLRRSLPSTLPIGDKTRALLSHARLSNFDRQKQEDAVLQWFDVLSRFEEITSLTLRINGNTNWPGYTEIEETLVSVRRAIEHAHLPELRTLNLMPVHAMGIIHLQWSGLGVFGESKASAAEVWERIETLDLRINYPSTATAQQQITFKKLFYEYLYSFSPSLKCLRLVWLGVDGPSPLAMHLDPSLKHERRKPIRWPKLRELWLGNITHPHQTIRLIPELAPAVTLAQTLRSTRRDSIVVDANDSSAWMEVLLGGRSLPTNMVADRASSVYSRESVQSTEPWAEGISRSSREVLFVRDF